MMSDANSILELLVQSVSADGGWGYRTDQPTHLEPTCLALLALSAEPERYNKQIDAGFHALQQHYYTDGTYRLNRGRIQAVWPTALATLALLRHHRECKASLDALIRIESKLVKMDASDAGSIDSQLLGWPWAEETFSWVEPTAWACIALRSAGKGNEPRVQEGLRLLLDRAHDSGGANYGSKVILGAQTEPMPGPTAILSIALQGVTNQPKLDAARGYLRIVANETSDLETLAWIKLALSVSETDTSKDELPKLDDKIRQSLARETAAGLGLNAGPLRLALTAMALQSRSPIGGEGLGVRENAFKLMDTPRVAEKSLIGCTKEAVDDRPTKSPEPRGFLARLKARLSNSIVQGAGVMRPLPASSAVHIARATSYEEPLKDILQKQFEHYREFVPIRGKRVVLKPNLVEYHRDRVINTDPRLIDAVIELFQGEGAAEVTVAEGPGHHRNVQYLVNESGLGDVLRKRDVRFVDINHDEPVKTLNAGRTTGLEFLYLSKTILEADVLVSLPKLKTHHWAGATLSLKNLFGTLPGICYGWPKNELHWRGIPNSIVDIALTRTPHLAIVDGIVGMEGDGPLAGTAKHVGAIVMGIDLLAVDATCCRLMKLPPERLATLLLAHRKRLGRIAEVDIQQLGESIKSLAQQFSFTPQIEQLLLPIPS